MALPLRTSATIAVAADCLLLIMDAADRAGYTQLDLLNATLDKLAANELREWPDWRNSDPELPIEHVRREEKRPVLGDSSRDQSMLGAEIDQQITDLLAAGWTLHCKRHDIWMSPDDVTYLGPEKAWEAMRNEAAKELAS